jgi:hypothetical protein
VELTQPGFIEKMVGKFEEYLPSNYREEAPKISMKAGEQLDDIVSDEEWEKAKHLPFPSMVCAMNYCGDHDEIGMFLLWVNAWFEIITSEPP